MYMMLKKLEDEILDITKLPTNDFLNAKTNEAKDKTTSLCNLATTTSQTAI